MSRILNVWSTRAILHILCYSKWTESILLNTKLHTGGLDVSNSKALPDHCEFRCLRHFWFTWHIQLNEMWAMELMFLICLSSLSSEYVFRKEELAATTEWCSFHYQRKRWRSYSSSWLHEVHPSDSWAMCKVTFSTIAKLKNLKKKKNLKRQILI